MTMSTSEDVPTLLNHGAETLVIHGDGMQKACNCDCSQPLSTYVEKDLTARESGHVFPCVGNHGQGARRPPWTAQVRPSSCC